MLFCPSMMCADFNHLGKEVADLEVAGADSFHIDIMDGKFVPNFGMGLQDLIAIRRQTNRLIDVHLMIDNPSEYVELFADLGADIIYVHPETDSQITRTLEKIKNKGKIPGIVINPGTSIAQIKELLPLVDYVMVMTVNPGFAGQKYLPFVNQKIQDLIALKESFEFEVLVDGAISLDKIKRLSKIGVDGFVLGTSALFGQKESYQECFQIFREYEEGHL